MEFINQSLISKSGIGDRQLCLAGYVEDEEVSSIWQVDYELFYARGSGSANIFRRGIRKATTGPTLLVP